MPEATPAVVEKPAPVAEPVVSEADAEADLSAGFDKVRGEAKPSPEAKTAEKKSEPKAEEPKKEEAAPAAEPAKPAAETPVAEKPVEAPAEKPTLIAGMTEAEWTAAVAKGVGPVAEAMRAEIRKNFSQIGTINRTVQELQKKLSAGSPGRKITPEMLKRVNEELPGLGDALAHDLSEALGSAEVAQAAAESKGQAFDQEKFFAEKIGPALQQIEDRANEKAELRIVKSIHRDFETVVKSPEFGAWLGTLTPERQTEVRESNDGFVAADAVTEFKVWKDKAEKEKAKKTTRLEAAITPKGGGAQSKPTQDDEADFNAGYKKAAKK